MDEVDTALLGHLRENARSPVAELARALGLSRTTVQSRIARLERTGVVAGYTVKLADAYARGEVQAYVMISVSPRKSGVVSGAARRFPEVRRLESVSGPFDLIALVAAPNMTELDRVIDALGELEGVERTTSSIVLSTKIDR